MRCLIQCEQEPDGRWVAEAPGFDGVIARGATKYEAVEKVKDLVVAIMEAIDEVDSKSHTQN